MNRVGLLHHHLGMGDHIICNGLVRSLIRRTEVDVLFLLCKRQNLATVRFMYRDHHKLCILPVVDDNDLFLNFFFDKKKIVVARVGFKEVRMPDWDVSFYDQSDVPFEERWRSFYYWRDPYIEEGFFGEKCTTNEPYILVHSGGSAKGSVSGAYDLRLPEGVKTIYVEHRNLFDYRLLVERAQEVHCVNSAFIHMVNSFGAIKPKLFFHDIRKMGDLDGFARHPDQEWETVHYEEKVA